MIQNKLQSESASDVDFNRKNNKSPGRKKMKQIMPELLKPEFQDVSELFGSHNIRIYWYEVINGNNPAVVQRVMSETFRSMFWRDIKNPLDLPSSALSKSVNADNQRQSDSGGKNFSMVQLNFKWNPVSMKQDFMKIESRQNKGMWPFRSTAINNYSRI